MLSAARSDPRVASIAADCGGGDDRRGILRRKETRRRTPTQRLGRRCCYLSSATGDGGCEGARGRRALLRRRRRQAPRRNLPWPNVSVDHGRPLHSLPCRRHGLWSSRFEPPPQVVQRGIELVYWC